MATILSNRVSHIPWGAIPWLQIEEYLSPDQEKPRRQIEEQAVRCLWRFLEDRQHGLPVLLLRLLTLEEEKTDEQDLDAAVPTPYARSRAVQLVHEAYSLMEGFFPLGWPSLDPQGGIRIEWTRLDRHVRLVLPAKSGGQNYIYHESSDDYGIDQNVSGTALSRWLDWLVGR